MHAHFPRLLPAWFPRAAALALLAAAASGCMPKYIPEDRTDRRARELQITSHQGGSHHRTFVEGGRWFQTFSNALLVIDTTNGRELGSIEPIAFGNGGALTDLLVDGDRAYVVSDQTAVAEVDVSESASPKLILLTPAAELGIEPRALSKAGNEVYASGTGGVVRLSDGQRFLVGESAGRVVQTAAGPAAAVRRRILLLEDGRYLGAASDLSPLPAGMGPANGFLFVLQGSNGASVGFMNEAFGETAQVAIPAVARRARICGDRLFILTDRLLYTWRIEDGKFVEPEEIKLKGGRDIDIIRPNHYAVSGTFGRAMYRHKREGRVDGDTFYNVQREAGLLEVAVGDGRRILSGGREGFWLWRIGGEATLSDKTTDITAIPGRNVAAAWGSARIVTEKAKESETEFGLSVEIKHDNTITNYAPEGNPRITVLSLVDGDIWVGHERGIDVLRRIEVAAQKDPKTGKMMAAVTRFEAISRFVYEGPTLFIFPENLGGGASVVSLHGGFLLMKPTPVGAAPVFQGRGEVK